MTHGKRTHWILCYDIADPKRLARVHRYLKKEGIPLQYSVFMLRETQAGISNVLSCLEKIIDPDRDDIRAYPVPANAWKFTLGAPLIPADIWLDEE